MSALSDYEPTHRGQPKQTVNIDIFDNGEYRDIPVRYTGRHVLEPEVATTAHDIKKAAKSLGGVASSYLKVPIIHLPHRR